MPGKPPAQRYLFSYGTLINQESLGSTIPGRLRTRIPARVNGFQAGWTARAEYTALTALGCRQAAGSNTIGVLIPVEELELEVLDERETRSIYKRISIPIRSAEVLSPYPQNPSSIESYVVHEAEKPDKLAPIAQSYLDVVLGGCLSIGNDFAESFISNVTGWNHPWVNDRNEPRYIRAQRNPSLEKRIDQLLERLVPEAFDARYRD